MKVFGISMNFDETVLVFRTYLTLNISIYQSFFVRSEISGIVAQVILVPIGSSFHFLQVIPEVGNTQRLPTGDQIQKPGGNSTSKVNLQREVGKG